MELSPRFALSALPYGGAPSPFALIFFAPTARRYHPLLTLRPLRLRFVAATPSLSSLGNAAAFSRITRRCPLRRPFVLSAFVMAPLSLLSPCCLSRPMALRLLSPYYLSRPTSRLPSPVLSTFSRPVACPVRHLVRLLLFDSPYNWGWRCAVGGVGRDFSSTARSRLYSPAWLLPMVGGQRALKSIN
uniref:Transmembrane protein n=1 Tax=Ananas comosus var. bracteatus TaxID=296719 RepID=A0A6V7P209_ANACO|nr:unnamed protein product [Ananas comosus var. bracteatus]